MVSDGDTSLDMLLPKIVFVLASTLTFALLTSDVVILSLSPTAMTL